MKLHKLLLALCLLPSLISAQTYGLEVEVVNEDIGVLVGALGTTDLTGYSCYRGYITMENSGDFLSSISGDATNPTFVSTTTDFYQNALGAAVPNGINSLLFPVYPDLAYDSWVTIGLEGTPNAGIGEANVSTVQSATNPWATTFDPGGGIAGGNIAINDLIGGAWYALNGDANGVAGDDLKVLMGQFTTTGDLSIQCYTQIFIGGDGQNEVPGEDGAARPTFYYPSGNTPGCTDAEACNYDDAADSDDGSCEYPTDPLLDCNGDCINDADSDGVCDENEAVGCTEEGACNYNANATDDDGTCEYLTCAGCTDDTACNYDMAATIDNGSCEFTSCAGCTDATACNYDMEATLDDGSCDYSCIGCTDDMACNYDADATVDSGDCTYPATDYVDCDGNCLNDEDEDGLCDEEEGCGDPMACNYDASAAVEAADYCLIVDTVMVHTAGNLAGMTTYRYYVKCANPADFVSAVSGDVNNPTVVNTTTDFYQDELGGATPNGIISFLFGQFPDLQYDSWVTIGLSESPNTAIGEAGISTVQGTANPWATNFDPGFGAAGDDIVIDDEVGGAWYALNGDNNGIAANHPDQQVLIAQLTTSGDIEGNFYVQIFENGDGQDGEIFFNFNIGDACIAPDDDCLYVDDVYGVDYVDCDGNCLNDADEDGICDEDEIPGCTDEMALNYDDTATDDNGLCEYPAASVFDIIADSEVHTVLEDLVVAADLDGTLTNDGPWTVFAPTDAAVGALPSFIVDALLADVDLIAAVLTYHVAADSVTSDMLSNGLVIDMINGQQATITFSGGSIFIEDAEIIIADLIAENGVVHVIDAVLVPSIEGCTELVSCNYNPIADVDDGSCETISCSGCLDEMACNYDSTATINDAPSCTYPIDLYDADYYDCLGNCLNDADGDGICDEAEVDGCIYEDACNYNPEATEDDGSCDYASCAGCTDETACNYDMEATLDDGSCQDPVDIYGNPNVDCDGVCLNDADGDGVCDEDEIATCYDPNACNTDSTGTDYDPTLCDYTCLGCTDSDAANYNPTSTIDDGSCIYCELTIDSVVTVMDVTCAGDMDGSIMIEGSAGGYGAVNYALEGGVFQDNLTFAQLDGGSYKVIAMDSLMCTDTLEVNVNEPAAIQLFAFANDANCNGDDNGSIVVTSEGGTGVITYDLGGVTNVDGNFEDLDAGPYTVFATDANGCEADIAATVEEPDAIVITVDGTENPDNAPNGSIDVSVTGGTGDLTYAWVGPNEAAYDTEDLAGLEEAGTYTLTVTDENGCEESEVVTLTDVSITEAGGALGISLMPNPSNGQVILELNRLVDGAIVEVFDGAGRRVFRQEGMTLSGKVQMDFSALSDGVYQVRLTADQVSVIEQLMIRH